MQVTLERAASTAVKGHAPADTAYIREIFKPKVNAPATDPVLNAPFGPTATWQLPSHARLRTVESVLITAVMGYMAFGLLSVFIGG